MPAEINRQLTYLSERNIDDAFVKHFKDHTSAKNRKLNNLTEQGLFVLY